MKWIDKSMESNIKYWTFNLLTSCSLCSSKASKEVVLIFIIRGWCIWRHSPSILNPKPTSNTYKLNELECLDIHQPPPNED